MNSEAAAKLWSSTRRLTGALLGVWLAVNLIGPWFARDLDELMRGGFAFSFWIAAEGALLLYLGLIVWYALAMDRLETRYLREQQDEVAGDDTVAK